MRQNAVLCGNGLIAFNTAEGKKNLNHNFPFTFFRWNKSRGQPAESARASQTLSREASFTLSIDDEDLGSNSTPYRLPRLSPQGDITLQPDLDNVPEEGSSPINDKVWSRYGYEKIIRYNNHSEHLGQSLDQASDVCRRSNMLRKLTCIAGSSYSSAALNEIIP